MGLFFITGRVVKVAELAPTAAVVRMLQSVLAVL